MATLEGRALVRSLLKAIQKHLTVEGNDSRALLQDTTQYIIHAARSSATQVANGVQPVQLAQDYLYLIDNIAHHKELLVRYRIGMDESERSKEMIEATARRVGFDLPPSHTKESDASFSKQDGS